MHFLIADEYGIFRTGLKQILLEEFPSATIEEAMDAETVIQKSFAHNWDLITCDMLMTGRSSLDLIKHILNYSTTPVLVISTYPEKQYALQALEAGAAGYLDKDIAIEELKTAILRVLQGHKYIPAPVV
ncbi:MAG: response regulator transcription factor [Bacteroidota bacterium]